MKSTAKIVLVTAINEKSKSIKETKNNVIDKFAGKEPHEIFQQYVNCEIKEVVVEETNRYAPQKNTNCTFSVTDLKTFSVVLILTGYHSPSRTSMFWEKELERNLKT